ncbi:hypothetical protein D3C86_1995850 [compost metagenome]
MKIMLRDSDNILSEDKDFMSHLILQRHLALTEALAKRAEAGEIREMDFRLAAKQIISVGMMAVLGQFTAVNMMETDLDSYLKKMVAFTVSLWRK